MPVPSCCFTDACHDDLSDACLQIDTCLPAPVDEMYLKCDVHAVDSLVQTSCYIEMTRGSYKFAFAARHPCFPIYDLLWSSGAIVGQSLPKGSCVMTSSENVTSNPQIFIC